MSIKRKFITLNILNIIIVIGALLLSATVFWEGTGIQYEEVFEGVVKDDKQTYSMQGYLHAYFEEIGHQIEEKEEEIHINSKMEKLQKKIDATGYHFAAYLHDKPYFNNMSEAEQKIWTDVAQTWGKDNLSNCVLSLSDGTVMILERPYSKDWDIYCVAVRLPDATVLSRDNGLMITIIKYFLIVCILLALALAITSLIYLYQLRKLVFIPIEALQKEAANIGQGDFDKEIKPIRNDEIGILSQEFNDMRIMLKNASEERKTNAEYRAEMLAGISHDLRSPLTSIVGYTEGMLEGIADTKEKREKYCKAILIRAHDMERLSDSLGTYMSLETGRMQYHFEKASLNRFIWRYVNQNEETDFEEWKIQFRVNLCEEIGLVLLDETQMRRVFNNIIQNSVKYRTKDTSVISIETYMEEANQVVTITDDGPGVNAQSISKIFQCFYRGDASRTNPGKGSGLGLSIVREIIEGHGGRIKAVNKGGLSIIIELPLMKEKRR